MLANDGWLHFGQWVRDVGVQSFCSSLYSLSQLRTDIRAYEADLLVKDRLAGSRLSFRPRRMRMFAW